MRTIPRAQASGDPIGGAAEQRAPPQGGGAVGGPARGSRRTHREHRRRVRVVIRDSKGGPGPQRTAGAADRVGPGGAGVTTR